MLPHKHTHIHTEIPFYHLILSMHFVSHTIFILFCPIRQMFLFQIINISVLKQTKTNKHYICYALCFPLSNGNFSLLFSMYFSYLLRSKWILLYTVYFRILSQCQCQIRSFIHSDTNIKWILLFYDKFATCDLSIAIEKKSQIATNWPLISWDFMNIGQIISTCFSG